MELHQPRQAYETRQSTGSPCYMKLKKGCGVTVMLRVDSMSTGVTVQVVALTIYRRVLDLEIGTAGGYCPHIVRFWGPVHCLSATAVFLEKRAAGHSGGPRIYIN